MSKLLNGDSIRVLYIADSGNHRIVSWNVAAGPFTGSWVVLGGLWVVLGPWVVSTGFFARSLPIISRGPSFQSTKHLGEGAC